MGLDGSAGPELKIRLFFFSEKNQLIEPYQVFNWDHKCHLALMACHDLDKKWARSRNIFDPEGGDKNQGLCTQFFKAKIEYTFE